MKQTVKVITNYKLLSEQAKQSIAEEIGCCLARMCLEIIPKLPIDPVQLKPKLNLNNNYGIHSGHTNTDETPSPSFTKLSKEDKKRQFDFHNTNLPLNGKDEPSEPTEAQNKD